MGKKNKKRQESRRRYSEKKRRYARLWDWTALGVLALIIICALIVHLAEVEKVAAPGAGFAGFAGWFLLVIGYLPLLVAEAAELLAGLPPTAPTAATAVALGIADTVFLALVWGVVRLVGRHRAPDFTRCAWHFLLIVFYWGIFQLLCSGLSLLWNHPAPVAAPETTPVAALVAKNGK